MTQENAQSEFISPYPLNTAVLFLVFNRPEPTKQVFETIKQAKPPRLYIAADGARKDKRGEAQRVAEVRRLILDNIDWHCEIKTLFREQNLGCGMAVSAAITWFFENEEMGIILEDDCLPSQSFFWFCEELLEKYKNDMRVGMVSGNNFQNGVKRGEADYFFSFIPHTWGWATWADRWQGYDVSLISFENDKFIDDFIESHEIKTAWKRLFSNFQKSLIDIWDFQWCFHLFRRKQLSIQPNKNIVSNIGWGVDATHTFTDNGLANLPKFEVVLKNHPKEVTRNVEADQYWERVICPKNFGRSNRFTDEDYELVLNTPRFTEFEVNFFDTLIKVPDSASLKFLNHELFGLEIYKFLSDTDEPLIIDCGANIGLSIIYFKKLYPNAKVIAFEPDNKIFDCLKFNIDSFGFKDVELIKKGLWKEKTTLRFFSEGADGGRIASQDDNQKIIEIETVKLSDYLKNKTCIDFLKLDIEGAETEVLLESKEDLKNVKNIFIEYHSFVDKEQTLSTILNILEQNGLRYYIEHIGVKSKHPFISINNYVGFDNQLNIFGYRV